MHVMLGQFARPRLNAVPISPHYDLEFPAETRLARSSPEQFFLSADWQIEIMNKIKVCPIIPTAQPRWR